MNCFTSFKKLGRTLAVSAVLAASAVSSASALDMSWGLGLLYTGDFGAGLYGFEGTRSQYIPGAGTIKVDVKDKAPWSGEGLTFFIDATYAEIGLALYYGSGTREGSASATIPGYGVYTEKRDDDVNLIGFNIGLFGKYPVELNEGFTLFPLVGIDYAVALASTNVMDQTNGKTSESGDFSALWIKFGAGCDLSLSEKWYFRPEILYGIRLENKYESDMSDNYGVDPISGGGLTVKVGFGHRL